jgi:hypothetical protein
MRNGACSPLRYVGLGKSHTLHFVQVSAECFQVISPSSLPSNLADGSASIARRAVSIRT